MCHYIFTISVQSGTLYRSKTYPATTRGLRKCAKAAYFRAHSLAKAYNDAFPTRPDDWMVTAEIYKQADYPRFSDPSRRYFCQFDRYTTTIPNWSEFD